MAYCSCKACVWNLDNWIKCLLERKLVLRYSSSRRKLISFDTALLRVWNLSSAFKPHYTSILINESNFVTVYLVFCLIYLLHLLKLSRTLRNLSLHCLTYLLPSQTYLVGCLVLSGKVTTICWSGEGKLKMTADRIEGSTDKNIHNETLLIKHRLIGDKLTINQCLAQLIRDPYLWENPLLAIV